MKTAIEFWDERIRKHGWGKYPSEHVIKFIARNYYNKDRATIKILDFGCGGGQIPGSLPKKVLIHTRLTEQQARLNLPKNDFSTLMLKPTCACSTR